MAQRLQEPPATAAAAPLTPSATAPAAVLAAAVSTSANAPVIPASSLGHLLTNQALHFSVEITSIIKLSGPRPTIPISQILS